MWRRWNEVFQGKLGHVAPPETSDVVDEARVRLVVLAPGATHKRSAVETAAAKEARRFLESRGNGQRLYKNMLLFVAADETDAEALGLAVRDFLAWQSIQAEQEALNLDAQQSRQVAASLQKADETVTLRLRSGYNWLLVPVQPDPLGPIELQAGKIGGDDNFYDRAARKLRNDGLLIYNWSPDMLRMELDRYIWSAERGWELRLKQLWEYLAQYCYLPRLFDHEVLVKAVKDGVGRLDAPFAYATGKNSEGYHTGLVIRALSQVYFDDNSLLVHPDHVAEPPAVKPPELIIHNGGEDYGAGGKKSSEQTEQVKKVLSRYYGRVGLDAQRVNKDIALIVEEVIERLTGQIGCEVELTLEIRARRPAGFDESTVRTITENSRTLKFEHYDFEEG
jgi:hypothetical protein